MKEVKNLFSIRCFLPVIVDVVSDFSPDMLESGGTSGEVDAGQVRRGGGDFTEDWTVRRDEVDHSGRNTGSSDWKQV